MRDSAFRVGAFVLMSLLVLARSRAPANSLTLLGLTEPAGLIAFVAPDGRPGVVDPRSGSRVLLADDPQRAQFPGWSPAGDAVSFIGFDLSGPGVDVYRLGAGGEGVFERDRVYERAAEPPIYRGWSLDGRWLSVLANRGDGLGLYLLPAPGSADGVDAADTHDEAPGEPRLLATGAPFYWDWSRDGAFRSPAVSPSASWIAYATRDGGDARRVVLQRVGLDGAADGAAVVEAPHGYGPIVTIDNAATGDLTSVTDDLSLAFWWSPDGGSIAYLSPVAGWNGPEQQVALPVQAGGTRRAGACSRCTGSTAACGRWDRATCRRGTCAERHPVT